MNFDHSVGNMSLGKRMAEKTAEMIQSRSIQLQKGATQQWDPNKEPYKSWKERKYNVFDLAGVRTGQMLSQESLRGETTVHPTEVEMVYGTGDPPKSSATGHITDQDKKVTDRQKAEWFTDGRSGTRGRNAKGQFTAGPASGSVPGRPFYELDDDIADEVFKIVDEALDKIFGV